MKSVQAVAIFSDEGKLLGIQGDNPGEYFRIGGVCRPSVFAFGSSSTERCMTGKSLNAWGYMGRFLRRTAGGVKLLGVSGVSGQDSAGQLARFQQVLDSLKERPTHMILQLAANDIMGGASIQSVKDNITQMYKMTQEFGSIPCLMTPATLSNVSGITAQQVLRAAAISEHIRGICESDRDTRLIDLARWIGDTSSSSYSPISGAMLQSDGIHLTSYGAWLAGKAIFEALSVDVGGFVLGPAMAGLLYDATANPKGNLIQNPYLTGTGGTGGAWVTAGSVPTGMQLNRTAGTGTVSISTVTRADRPGTWKRFTFNMAAGDTYSMFMRPSDIGLPANAALYGMADARVDTSGAGNSVKRVSLRVRDAANTLTVWDGLTPGANVDHIEPVHALENEFFRTQADVFANYGNGSLSIDLEFTGPGTLIIDIDSVGLYQKFD